MTESTTTDSTHAAADITTAAAPMIASINEHFIDTIVFLARVLADAPNAASARVVSIDAHGIVAMIDDEPEPRRVDFLTPLSSLDDLLGACHALVELAREQSGEQIVTSVDRFITDRQRIRTFVTAVVAVEDINPHLRQITFGGGDLVDFAPLSADTFLYVLLPPPGRDQLTIGRDFSWDHYDEMPEDERPVGAYYTLRRWRADVSELDMQFVLHGDEGAASRWASRATVGDPVALWGPRAGYEPPAGTTTWVLVADETGIPATAVILEQLPPGARAHVIVEADGDEVRSALPDLGGHTVTWLDRNGAEAGTTTLLIDAVRAMPWPDGVVYAWGAAESRAATAVRRYVRDEIGLDRDAVSMTGYWRHVRHADDHD